MTVLTLAVACFALVAYSLLGRWFSARLITAPMALLVIGALSFGVIDSIDVAGEAVHVLAEVTLVLILFHDASTVRIRSLRQDLGPPLRLLAIGFPLALLATLATSWWLLSSIGLYGALLIAASITPTDAGLGAPTVLNPAVPVRVRRALNVESGLNDGLATPLVLFALTAVTAESGEEIPEVLQFAVRPLLLGGVVGVVGAVVLALLLDTVQRRKLASKGAAPITIMLIPFALFLVASLVDANIFIAAFVGGLAFGAVSKSLAARPDESQLLETASDIASWVVWFLAGGLAVEVFAGGISWQSVAIALLALTALRMIPVALSLMGLGFRSPTIAFIGWFGPRGLATVVFALLIVEELGVASPIVEPIVLTLAIGVIVSVFAHGASAKPLANRYGVWVKRRQPAAEVREVSAPPSRGQVWTSGDDAGA